MSLQGPVLWQEREGCQLPAGHAGFQGATPAGRLQGVAEAEASLVEQNLALVAELESVTAAFEALQVGGRAARLCSALPGLWRSPPCLPACKVPAGALACRQARGLASS